MCGDGTVQETAGGRGGVKAQRIEPRGIPAVEPITVTAPRPPFDGAPAKDINKLRREMWRRGRAGGFGGSKEKIIALKAKDRRKTPKGLVSKVRLYECLKCGVQHQINTSHIRNGGARCPACNDSLRRVRGLPGKPVVIKPVADDYLDPITTQQRRYLDILGVPTEQCRDMTKRQASSLISRLEHELVHPPANAPTWA